MKTLPQLYNPGSPVENNFHLCIITHTNFYPNFISRNPLLKMVFTVCKMQRKHLPQIYYLSIVERVHPKVNLKVNDNGDKFAKKSSI